MAQGNWQFLHRSEEYIFYYRRAIPQLLRPSFDNKWEIKRSLKTREKSLAIIRHNEINVNVERLFLQARVGGVVDKDLSKMLERLKDRRTQSISATAIEVKLLAWENITHT